jgi:hypothetical protein
MKHNIEAEIWKDVVGYEGIYSVSNLGRVRRELLRTTGKPGKIMIPYIDHKGYERLQLTANGVRRKFFIHRLVATAFIPNPGNKPQVNHIDGIPLNNKLSNLEWNTASENQQHAHRIGLHKGFHTKIRKLTPEDVLKIRSYGASGVKHTDIAKVFMVNQSTISRIINGVRRTKGVQSYQV